MTEDIITAIGKIYNRIFDHKPFLSGELAFCIREFEEKRNDREVENIFATSETVSELKSNVSKKTAALAESSLPGLKEDLDKALLECEDLLRREPDPLVEAVLVNNRETRRKIWQDFVEDVSHKRSRIDITFEEKEEEIAEFYSDLERKLHIHK